MSQQVSIERFLSRTIVLQASAGGLKYNITQISFIARDGSLIVSFPYGKHSSGLLSSGSHATLRWSKVDSNSRSHVLSKRDAGSISCALGRWCEGWCGAPLRVRTVHGGTGSSNPLCSSKESAANLLRSPWRSSARGRNWLYYCPSSFNRPKSTPLLEE